MATNPLTEEHLQEINKGIEAAEDAIAQAEQAERAGIDVGNVKDEAQQALERLRRIKNVYFPNR